MSLPEAWFLIVRVGGKLFGFPVAAVCEVLRLPVLVGGYSAAVPGLLGMAELRGELVPVLELADLLEIPAGTEAAPDRRVVRMELNPAGSAAGRQEQAGARRVGFVVDAVLGVSTLGGRPLESIALPGGAVQQWGGFEAGFVQLLASGGLVTETMWQELAQ